MVRGVVDFIATADGNYQHDKFLVAYLVDETISHAT